MFSCLCEFDHRSDHRRLGRSINNIIFKGWMDGFAIFIAVIIIVSVTAGNNYIKDQQFRKLNAIAANRNINVIRGGKTISISIYDLLVGDIVYVETMGKNKK